MALILLIDDDDDLRHFLQGELEGQGHAVQGLVLAKHGPDALSHEPFDLVLLDNQMPASSMSGIEFLEALQERGLDVPVILMTGFANADTAIRAMNLGAFDYVIKPDDFQTLLRELEPVIAEALQITRPAKEVVVSPTAPSGVPGGLVLIGNSRPMVKVYMDIGRYARSDDAVLVLGETGTGKELVARAIHNSSPRKDKRFVALNCAALTETLLESELFGHEPNSFPGGKLRRGKFEYASGGTIFLDEIGDMPPSFQVKLLRVLEDQEVVRVGGNEPIKVNVRLLSATNRDLEADIAAGKFRSDLYYRLNRRTLHLPPLRKRLDDLPELAAYFLARAAEKIGRPCPELAESALQRLKEHDWPGNVRELQNVMYRACSACRGPLVHPEHLDFPCKKEGGPCPAAEGSEDEAIAALRKAVAWGWNQHTEEVWQRLRDLLERELLTFALAECRDNQTEVAKRLGMNRGTVIERMKKFGLGPQRNGPG